MLNQKRYGKLQMNHTRVKTPMSRCRAGLGTADITPPVGIYHRFWGAARHDQATGVHRPLRATVLLLAPDAFWPLRRVGVQFHAAQDGKTAAERVQNLDGAIAVHPRRRHRLTARPILLVDDVMTSGATFAACTHALQDAGSGEVFVLALARVIKDA